jgi:prolipoprotein diacylglyceryl transferase
VLYRPRVPLASIPSPSSPFIVEVGPLHLRWYGVLLALGVLLAAIIARRELRRRGIDPELTYPIALWVVPLGLIGARLYHVVTDWARFSGHLLRIPEIWSGGLGIPGAIAGGALGGWIAARRHHLNPWTVLDCIVPGVAAAQALGRFGNYFNQELFGRPTDLPWGLEIDPANRPPGYAQYSTFHPTFLYESLWDVTVCLILLWVSRRAWNRLRPGAILALYCALYFAGRFFIEGLRIDPAHHIAGLRLNQVTSLVVVAVAVPAFLILRRPAPDRRAGA